MKVTIGRQPEKRRRGRHCSDTQAKGNRKVDDARTNAIRDATPGVQSPAQVKEMGGEKAYRKKVGAGMDDEHN